MSVGTGGKPAVQVAPVIELTWAGNELAAVVAD
jgi:hypothetical protein